MQFLSAPRYTLAVNGWHQDGIVVSMCVSTALQFRQNVDLAPRLNLLILSLGVMLATRDDVIVILGSSTAALAQPKDVE
jgi:hypothetical protein